MPSSGHAIPLLREGGDLVFLASIQRGAGFPRADGSAPQPSPTPEIDAELGRTPLPHDRLFLGDALSLFGRSEGEPLVWAVPGSIR